MAQKSKNEVSAGMVRNYLKTVWRHLRRHKGYAAINIAGLALGIACCLLFTLYALDELNYDRFHEKADSIFRVVTEATQPSGETVLQASGPALLGPSLGETFPEIAGVVRLARNEARVSYEGLAFDDEVLFADASLLDVFTFLLVSGGQAQGLGQPGTMVLSERAAQKYFGPIDPLGRYMAVAFSDDTLTVRVAGVVRDVPAHSSIQFDLVLPFENVQYTLPQVMRRQVLDGWVFPAGSTFIELADPAQADDLAQKLPGFVVQQYGEAAAETRLRLQPLGQVYRSPEITKTVALSGNPSHAYVLAGIALLVLLVACVNFMVLALARSSDRVKEVGVRKVMGARRSQVRVQFWGEAVLTGAMALLVSLGLIALFLPVFSQLAGKDLSLALLMRFEVVVILAGLTLLAGLVAGGYPAVVLSRFDPAAVLKGSADLRGGRSFTQVLVVVQFTLSIACMAGTLVIARQSSYLADKPLGFDKEHVLLLHLRDVDEGARIYPRLHDQLAGYEAIEGTATSWNAPFGHPGWPAALQLGDTAEVHVFMNVVGENFLETLGVELAEGRDFSAARSTDDKQAVLVNQALLRTLGWESVYGKQLPLKGSIVSPGRMDVIGVVKDFHFRSLHHLIQPAILVPRGVMGGGVGTIYIRIKPDRVPQTLALIKDTWKQVAAGEPFDYDFLDALVAAKYQAEQQWQAIMRYATVFALLISCLGLFGMATLTVEQRTKEIGIRKVLGASVSTVFILLTKDFVKLIVIAFVLAGPLAYFPARRWLEQFAYRIDLGLEPFLWAGTTALILAGIAVGYRAVRAAMTDPVASLRYE